MRSKAKVIPLRQAPKNGKLVLRRPKNSEVRTREYLTEREVERLMKAAKDTVAMVIVTPRLSCSCTGMRFGSARP